MIFIFGISPRTKVIGPAIEKKCPRCNNERFWLLMKVSQLFSLFFIPLIPISTKYLLQCPICTEAQPLTKEEFTAYEQKAELNNEALQSNMTNTEYTKRTKNL